jgi:hypothetical protein
MEPLRLGLVKFHQHRPRLFLEDALAYISKRDGGLVAQDAMGTRGRVFVCVHCPSVLFAPHPQRFEMTEVTLDQ